MVLRPAIVAAWLVAVGGCQKVPSVPDALPSQTNEPKLLAGEQPGPSAIALDATHLYWNHAGSGLIRRMPRSGGAVETVYDGGGELGGRSIALDADAVYFDQGWDVKRVAKRGGPATQLGPLDSLPAVLVADDEAVYSVTHATVARHAKGGGDTRFLANGSDIWDVAVDATHVYWVSDDGVLRVPKKGGATQTLARGRFRFARIALFGNDVYWGDGGLGGVFTVPKEGGGARFVAHAWSIGGTRLVVDGRGIWTVHGDGQIDRVDPRTGKSIIYAVALARGGSADHYFGVVLAEDDLFVASGGMSYRGGGPVIIDLTKPGADLPKADFGGEILRLSIVPPAKPIVAEDLLPEVGRVWFTDMRMQDPGNATRWTGWIDESWVRGVKDGKLGLRLVAFTSATVPSATATARAKIVEDEIRGQLGAGPRIAIVTAASEGYHGDVHVTLDPADLAAALDPSAR